MRISDWSSDVCSSDLIPSPSTAEEMVMAGVIMPSANKAAPPSMAGKTIHLPFFRTSEKSERIPPSPLLSARRVMMTYFKVVCNVSVQKTHDSPPSTSVGLMVSCPTIHFKTYKGDVPLSP